LLLVAARGQATDPLVDAMSREHAGDSPVASEAARGPVTKPVEERAVVYGDIDGRELRGFLARPDAAASAPGILVIHEWWGLNDNIRAMARQLAAAGYAALAVDLYGGESAVDARGARALMSAARTEPRSMLENLRQAHEYLKRELGASRTGSIGWCFGGGLSLEAALMLGPDLDAAVMYYGSVVTDEARLRTLRAPVLGLFGSADRGIPVESVRAFEKALGTLGKEARILVYEGADHAFANPSGTRYQAEAAEDAWRRTLEFFQKTLGP
jgi:carboxymethylenebutenolidase